MPDDEPFFRALGARIRALRQNHGFSQEDMISLGFQVRYWQRIEAGKPITVRTLLRICRLFSTPIDRLVRGLDPIPRSKKPEIAARKRRRVSK